MGCCGKTKNKKNIDTQKEDKKTLKGYKKLQRKGSKDEKISFGYTDDNISRSTSVIIPTKS